MPYCIWSGSDLPNNYLNLRGEIATIVNKELKVLKYKDQRIKTAILSVRGRQVWVVVEFK